MIADLGSREIEVIIQDVPGGSPGWTLDVTNAVVDLTLSCNQLDTQTPNGTLSVSGSMTIVAIVGATYSIDPRDTSGSPSAAQVWSRGRYVKISIADTSGTLRQVDTELYIRTVPSPPNLPENIITVELTDKLGLQDYPDPEGDNSGITLGVSTDRKTIINSLATAASLPSVASGDSLTAYPLSVPVPKGDTRSYARFIGQCAATAGALVWQDNSGDLRITTIDLEPASAVFSITLGHGEAEFDFINNDERPPETLTVTGSGTGTTSNTYPRTTETSVLGTKESIKEGGGDDEIVVYRERVRENLSGNTLTRTTTIFMPRAAINPNSTVFNYSLRVASERVERQTYRADTGALIKRTISEDRAKGYINQTNLNNSEEFTTDLSDLISYEDCTETFDYDVTQGFLKERNLRIDRVRAYFGAGFANPTDLVQVQDDREKWTKKSGKEWQRELSCRKCAQEVYSENVGELSPFALVIDSDASLSEQSDTGSTDPPPAQLLPDAVNQEPTVYEGSAEFLPVGGSAPVPKSQTINMQGLFFVSDDQCRFLADLVGRVRQGRALGARLTTAIPDWFLTSYSPYSAVDITYNSITTRYLIDGWSIALDGQEAAFSCGLLEIGTVASGIVTPRFETITQQLIETGSTITIDQVLPPEQFEAFFSGPVPSFAAEGQEVLSVTAAFPGPVPSFAATVAERPTVLADFAGPVPDMAGAITAPGLVTAAMAGPVPDMAGAITAPGLVTAAMAGPVPDMAATVEGNETVQAAMAGPVPDMAATVESSGTTDPNFANVSLLLHMDGTNGSTTFTDSSSSTKTVNVFGDAQISTTSPKFGTGEGLFDGSGDYLEVPASADFEFGTGLFTVDVWVKTTQGTGFHQPIGQYFPQPLDGEWSLRTENQGGSGGGVGFSYRTASAYIDDNSGFSINDGNWHFLRFVRESSTVLRLYVDGVLRVDHTISASQTLGRPGRGIRIARTQDDASNTYDYNGSIDDVRITKGVARSGAEVPTAPFPDSGPTTDPNFANVSLLLHTDGTNGSTTFTDSSSNGFTVTANGNAQLTTANQKFGTASGDFDGAGDYLSWPTDTAFNVGTGDFTVEMFVYSDGALNVIRNLFVLGGDSAATGLHVRNTGVLGWFIDGTGWLLTGSTTLSTSTWYYVAVKRDSGTLSLHLGTTGSTSTEASIASHTNSYDFSSYRLGEAIFNNDWDGQIDELRITKGVARDVSTVPTAPFPDS